MFTLDSQALFRLTQQQQYPPSYNTPLRNDGSDDEADSRALLHNQPPGPFGGGPFDDPHSRTATPPVRPTSGYSLNETYAAGDHPPPMPYNDPYKVPTAYSGTALDNPTAAFGVPGRTGSPYARSETSSTEAWRQRQAPNPDLRRYATRKVKLIQGSVLSVDYPVPSAIQNAIQTRYRTDADIGSEEFTHMRCMKPDLAL